MHERNMFIINRFSTTTSSPNLKIKSQVFNFFIATKICCTKNFKQTHFWKTYSTLFEWRQ